LHLLVCAFPQVQIMTAHFLQDFSEITCTISKFNSWTRSEVQNKEKSVSVQPSLVNVFLPQFFLVYHLARLSKVADDCRVLEVPPVAAHN